MRRLTRAHPLEEQARPERVLWHQKTLTIARGAADAEVADFSMLTEIFRLNLGRWLSHTDDPNRKIVFADPEDALVYQVTTRRVYNINVVYRLCAGDADAPWHRIRVVVSRKGIERIRADLLRRPRAASRASAAAWGRPRSRGGPERSRDHRSGRGDHSPSSHSR